MKLNFTNKEPIEIKEGALAAGDILPGVQISPLGDWPQGQTIQHVTEEAVRQMIAAWQKNGSKEILCDFEHRSEEGGTSDTSAAAWISNLAFDPERGLVADFTFTDVGAKAVSSRRLRFLSPVWECEVTRWIDEKRGIPAEVVPTELVSVALTNTPNIPVAPILNKGQPDNSTVEDKEKSMDKIKEALGLAPEATEEEVLNAITAMVKAKKDADEAALEKEAEDFAERNSKKCNKEVLKAQYLANKEVAKALVAGIPDAPEKPQQLLNKGGAKAPAKGDDLYKELNKLPAGEARIKFITEHAAEFADAAK